MDRCTDSVGVFRIGFQWLTMPEGQPERAMVMSHYSAERSNLEVDSASPVEAEICVHEKEWLEAIPGLQFNPYWRFNLERIGDAPPPPPDPAIAAKQELVQSRLTNLKEAARMAVVMGADNAERIRSVLAGLAGNYAELDPMTDVELYEIVKEALEAQSDLSSASNIPAAFGTHSS